MDTMAFLSFIEENDNSHFLFVNDGSGDDTLSLLLELHEKYPDRLLYMDLETNHGKANAVRKGIMKALKMNKFDFVGYFDADLATPLNEIKRLLKPFQKENVVMTMGSRVKRLGADIKRSPKRHFLGRIFATVTSNLINMPLYDSQCGAKIFRARSMDQLFDKEFMSRWLFDVEILFRIKRSQSIHVLDIVDIPKIQITNIPLP